MRASPQEGNGARGVSTSSLARHRGGSRPRAVSFLEPASHQPSPLYLQQLQYVESNAGTVGWVDTRGQPMQESSTNDERPTSVQEKEVEKKEWIWESDTPSRSPFFDEQQEELAYAQSRAVLQRAMCGPSFIPPWISSLPRPLSSSPISPAGSYGTAPSAPIESLCPLFASQDQLARLPPCLITAGERRVSLVVKLNTSSNCLSYSIVLLLFHIRTTSSHY